MEKERKPINKLKMNHNGIKCWCCGVTKKGARCDPQPTASLQKALAQGRRPRWYGVYGRYKDQDVVPGVSRWKRTKQKGENRQLYEESQVFFTEKDRRNKMEFI